MGLSEIIIDVDAVGRGTVEVDGVDIRPEITGFQFSSQPGQACQLVVQQYAGAGLIKSEGVVYVEQEPGAVDETSVILEWLANLDPEQLERDVLDSFNGLVPPATHGEAWLQALIRRVPDQ